MFCGEEASLLPLEHGKEKMGDTDRHVVEVKGERA